MSENTKKKFVRPRWISAEEWENTPFLRRLHLLRNYAADNTSLSLLLEIREEIRYYERVIRQIGEMTK